MSTNQGSANWNGGLKSGSGSISTLSGALKDIPYSFTKRFEGETGLNPEELIGAAHASCFSMALWRCRLGGVVQFPEKAGALARVFHRVGCRADGSYFGCLVIEVRQGQL